MTNEEKLKLDHVNRIKKLRTNLSELKKGQGCVGVKLSTEDSGHTWGFIEWVKNRIIEGILPLHVKVGGPDAKNDIRTFWRLDAQGVIGPMVESPFGVQKFVQALETIMGLEVMRQKSVSVNLESITAFENLEKILEIGEMAQVDRIVVGTTDLSKSLGQPVSSPRVIEIVTEMCKRSKKYGKTVRLGGVMSMAKGTEGRLKQLISDASPDEINTRVLAFNVNEIEDLSYTYQMSVRFEAELNQLWVEVNKQFLDHYGERASALESSLI